VALGLPPEGRAYLPHVTLARFGRGGAMVDPYLVRHAALSSAPFRIERFTLYESHIGHAGARYETVADYRCDTRS